MSTSNKLLLIVATLLLAIALGSLILGGREHCGGRGCINQHPASPSAAVSVHR
jgi:hypothetical protein